jgi:leader peptidase (prepilin peptidase)/N-methyltransferase
MELLTGSLFLTVFLTSTSLISLGLALVLVSLLIVIAVYDIKHMVIPHEFVFAMLAVAVVSLCIQTGLVFDGKLLTAHMVSAFGVSLFYATLWVVSKGRWIGLGDAKLAFPLGLMLMPLGGFSMVVLSFWIGAGVSIVLLLLQKLLKSGKKHLPFLHIPLTMKSEVPFAPFMLLAFLAVYLLQADVLILMTYFF